MRHITAFFVCSTVIACQFVSAATEQVADLKIGTIRLLDGYTYKHSKATQDRTTGEIKRGDSKLVIRYDIGYSAGNQVHPDRKYSGKFWYREQLINGCKSCLFMYEEDGKQIFKATIYKSATRAFGEPANFQAIIQSQEDLAETLLVVTSYKFKSKTRSK